MSTNRKYITEEVSIKKIEGTCRKEGPLNVYHTSIQLLSCGKI
jgi:hypothetical protein